MESILATVLTLRLRLLKGKTILFLFVYFKQFSFLDEPERSNLIKLNQIRNEDKV